MKRILTSFALVAASVAFSQVSIAPSEVTPEATLDVRAIGGSNTADGILVPRVDRARAQAMQNVKQSTLVYVNSIANGAQSGQANQIDATGFYYFDTTVGTGEWVKLGASAANAPVATLSHFSDVDYRLKPTDTVVVCDNGSTIKVIIPASEFVAGRNFVLLNNNCKGGVLIEDESGTNVLTGNSVNVEVQSGIGQHLYYDGVKWYNTTGY